MRLERAPEDADRLDPEALKRLIELQRLDREIMAAEDGSRRRPKELDARKAKRDAQAEKAKAAKDLVAATKRRIDAMGVESLAIRNDIAKLQGQLFSLKSNDEFNAMKGQIKAREEKNEAVQNQTLELMMAHDELEIAARREDAALAALQKDLAGFEQKIATEQAGANETISTLRQSRDAKAVGIPEKLLALYESIQSRRDGVGIAHVEDEICKGCDTRVTTQTLVLISAKRVVQCRNCDRILYG